MLIKLKAIPLKSVLMHVYTNKHKRVNYNQTFLLLHAGRAFTTRLLFSWPSAGSPKIADGKREELTQRSGARALFSLKSTNAEAHSSP